ncbi:PA1571 family protein [Marinobacter xestospongiae]|uniref:Uncharacterized protein n=1 Tax=Marinobacter xestospongiae TaxID=994319 RepID=A0ABU3VXT8_9GAMM|nr:PA1571 family protein [Marinobacter xestospongiae]MDV2079059.1 hypothetical protein [Marinobacter xestospongiae]
MREGKTVIQQKQNPEPWMNGAALVLSDGREVPITDRMVQRALETLLQPAEATLHRPRKRA